MRLPKCLVVALASLALSCRGDDTSILSPSLTTEANATGVGGDCAGFPFFDPTKTPALLGGHAAFEQDYHNMLRVALSPGVRLGDVVDEVKAKRCLAGRGAAKQFSLFTELATPSGINHTIESRCHCEGEWDLSTSPLRQRCVPQGYPTFFSVTSCGTHNVTLYAQSSIGQMQVLASASVELPLMSHLEKVDSGLSWAKLRFRPVCFPNRRYSVTCGSKTFENVTEDATVVVKDLLPATSAIPAATWSSPRQMCTYSRPVRGHLRHHMFELETRLAGEAVAFVAHDRGVFLVANAVVGELARQGSLAANVTVRDLLTNGTVSAPVRSAIDSGVLGLAPARLYSVCLHIAQKGGHCAFECRGWSVCRDVQTAPPKPRGQNLTPVWALIGVLITAVLLLAAVIAVLWLKLSGMGAPTAAVAWMQMNIMGRKDASNKHSNDTEPFAA